MLIVSKITSFSIPEESKYFRIYLTESIVLLVKKYIKAQFILFILNNAINFEDLYARQLAEALCRDYWHVVSTAIRR